MAKVEKSKPPWDAAVAVICEENEASGDDLSDGICGFADSHLRSSHCLVVASLLNGHPTKCNQFHPLPAFPRLERKMVPEEFFNRNYKTVFFLYSLLPFQAFSEISTSQSSHDFDP